MDTIALQGARGNTGSRVGLKNYQHDFGVCLKYVILQLYYLD